MTASNTTKGILGQVLAFTSLQVPVVLTAMFFWDQLKDSPVAIGLGVLSFVLWEACTFAFSFFRKVWKEELEKDAVKASASFIRQQISKIKPGFTRRYLKIIGNTHELFEDMGMGQRNPRRLRLEDVFVSLRIGEKAEENRKDSSVLFDGLRGEERHIWDFMRIGEPEGIALAVIGGPGCGKSTLLKHMFLVLARNRQRRKRVRARIPILLYLRNLAKPISEAFGKDEQPTLGDLAEKDLRHRYLSMKPSPDWFERHLQKGDCLVLLDGLDEVGDPQVRKAVSAWVDLQIERYRKSRFLVTSRPKGYESAPLRRGQALQVQPFSPKQVSTFVSQWYLANEISGAPKDDTRIKVESRARNEATELENRLSQAPALLELTGNPLLLTMICMVHRFRGQLPGGRVQLYRSICEVLLEKWRQGKELDDPFTADQKMMLLQPLAAWMMEKRMRTFEMSSAFKTIRTPLQKIGVSPKDQQSFLAKVATDSGLLVEQEAGQWAFSHLTFQEYLCACHWIEKGKPGISNLQEATKDSWWRETILLYAAQADATELIEAALQDGNADSLALAFGLIQPQAAKAIDDVTRQRVNNLISRDLESKDTDGFGRAVQAILYQRLYGNNQWRSLGPGLEISQRPLTNAEYQLFLDQDSSARPPLHWENRRFVNGKAREVVKGMTLSDGYSFMRWLQAFVNDKWQFRLPQGEKEINDTPGLGFHYQRSNTTSARLDEVFEELMDCANVFRGVFRSPTSGIFSSKFFLVFLTVRYGGITRGLSWAFSISLFHAFIPTSESGRLLTLSLSILFQGRLRQAHDIDLAIALSLVHDLYYKRLTILPYTRKSPLEKALDCALKNNRALNPALNLALALNFILHNAIDPSNSRPEEFNYGNERARAFSRSFSRARHTKIEPTKLVEMLTQLHDQFTRLANDSTSNRKETALFNCAAKYTALVISRITNKQPPIEELYIVRGRC